MGQVFPNLEKIGSLSYSAPSIILSSSRLTIGGQQYLINSLNFIPSALAASTLYMIYAVLVNGVVTLVNSTNLNTTGPNGFLSYKLVGAFRTNASSVFSSFSPLLNSLTSEFYEIPILDTIGGSLPIVKLASTPFLGYGQTWQDMTGSRGIGGVYSNNTGKPISLAITVTRAGVSTAGWGVSINGGTTIFAAYDSNSSGGNTGIGFFIVPIGATYQVNIISEAAGLSQWYELR